MTKEIPLPKEEVDIINEKCPCYMVTSGGNVITIVKASSEYFQTEYMWIRITDKMLLYRNKKSAIRDYPKQSNHCTLEQKTYLLEHYAEYYI